MYRLCSVYTTHVEFTTIELTLSPDLMVHNETQNSVDIVAFPWSPERVSEMVCCLHNFFRNMILALEAVFPSQHLAFGKNSCSEGLQYKCIFQFKVQNIIRSGKNML